MFSDNDDDGHDYDDEVPGATGSPLSLLRRKTKRIKENKDWFVIQVFFFRPDSLLRKARRPT